LLRSPRKELTFSNDPDGKELGYPVRFVSILGVTAPEVLPDDPPPATGTASWRESAADLIPARFVYALLIQYSEHRRYQAHLATYKENCWPSSRRRLVKK